MKKFCLPLAASLLGTSLAVLGLASTASAAPATATTVLSDNFNRSTLGSTWTTRNGDPLPQATGTALTSTSADARHWATTTNPIGAVDAGSFRAILTPADNVTQEVGVTLEDWGATIRVGSDGTYRGEQFNQLRVSLTDSWHFNTFEYNMPPTTDAKVEWWLDEVPHLDRYGLVLKVTPTGSTTPTISRTVAVASSANTGKVSVETFGPALIDDVSFTKRATGTLTVDGSARQVGETFSGYVTNSDAIPVRGEYNPQVCRVNENGTYTALAKGTCDLNMYLPASQNVTGHPSRYGWVTIRPVSPINTTVDMTVPTLYAGRIASVNATVETATYAELSAGFDGLLDWQVDGSSQASFDGPNSPTPNPEFNASVRIPQAGSYRVGAEWVPYNSDTTGSNTTQQVTVLANPVNVTQRLTRDTLSLTVAASEPTGPGDMIPAAEGTVQVTVDGAPIGTSPVAAGIATVALPAHVNGSVIAWTYSGDSVHASATGTLTTSSPTITATPDRTTDSGWYSAPVTYTFACDADTSTLEGECPAPVTFDSEGAEQRHEATIHTADGGQATSTVLASIDLRAPIVQVTGVTDGATYPALPDFSCSVTDALSGPDGCETTATELGQGKVQVTATGHDVAGNTATTSVTITIKAPQTPGTPAAPKPSTPSTPVVVGPVTVTPGTGAPKVTKSGTTVRIVRATKKRSTVVLTVKSRKRPTTLKLARNIKGIKIAKAKLVKKGKSGVRNWRITITMAPKATKRFNLKMRVNGKIRVLKLLIVR